MINSNALRALQNALGSEVTTDKSSLFKASFDTMKLSFMPEAVILPKSPASIGTALKIANEFRMPITPRGAGSTLTGSATPLKGGWVLDLTNLNNITIDKFNKLAHVQAGAITGDIQKAAIEHDLFYPPDPSSSSFCTIGGNIACNAGGLRGIKYGVTRDYVVALKGFLPNGEPVAWGRPLKKFTSGYNIRDLWIGSEGTLGVITEAVLKLIPKPQASRTFLAYFVDDQAALLGAQALLQTGLIPSVLEFMDVLTVLGVEQATHIDDQPIFHHAILLIELDGHPAVIEDETTLLVHWAADCTTKFIQAATQEEITALWHTRRACSAAMFQHGNSKLNEDVVVPLDQTVELIEFIQKISQEKNLKIPTFGHVGDGNFHVNIMYNREDKAACKHAEEALQSLMEFVIELGGAITGEHGIGLAKTPFFKLQHTKAEINAMLAIKNALDPVGILNPGKIFSPFKTWDYTPISINMPWEKKKFL